MQQEGSDGESSPEEGALYPPAAGPRVVLRFFPNPRERGADSPDRQVLRVDGLFSSGLHVLEQLLTLRGTLQALSAVQGSVNQLLLEHAMHVSLQDEPKGVPPIEAADWENTPEVTVSEYHLRLQTNQTCSVCHDGFTVGQVARQLPCGHLFCPDCIEEWLKLHRSCPLCRREVVDVPKPAWNLLSCGFEQLRKKECFGISTSLVVLSSCSHGFHRSCLRRYLRMRTNDASDDVRLECPLCKAVSIVSRRDLAGGAGGVASRMSSSSLVRLVSPPSSAKRLHAAGGGSSAVASIRTDGSRPPKSPTAPTRGGPGAARYAFVQE